MMIKKSKSGQNIVLITYCTKVYIYYVTRKRNRDNFNGKCVHSFGMINLGPRFSSGLYVSSVGIYMGCTATGIHRIVPEILPKLSRSPFLCVSLSVES